MAEVMQLFAVLCQHHNPVCFLLQNLQPTKLSSVINNNSYVFSTVLSCKAPPLRFQRISPARFVIFWILDKISIVARCSRSTNCRWDTIPPPYSPTPITSDLPESPIPFGWGLRYSIELFAPPPVSTLVVEWNLICNERSRWHFNVRPQRWT